MCNPLCTTFGCRYIENPKNEFIADQVVGALQKLESDIEFVAPCQREVAAYVEKGVPVYLYSFDYVPESPILESVIKSPCVNSSHNDSGTQDLFLVRKQASRDETHGEIGDPLVFCCFVIPQNTDGKVQTYGEESCFSGQGCVPWSGSRVHLLQGLQQQLWNLPVHQKRRNHVEDLVHNAHQLRQNRRPVYNKVRPE